MNTILRLLLVLACAATCAFAQSEPRGLDLPIEEPTYVGGGVQPTQPIQEDPPTDNGPRDEPPPTIYGEDIDSESGSVCYVIDVSGSMDWDVQSFITIDNQRASGPRIERAKAELVRSIKGLPKNFKFNCIAYDCGLYMWQRNMQTADDPNKASAVSWVLGLHPLGATATGPAVTLALWTARENKSVVLLTDGEPNCGTMNETMDEHRALIRVNNSQRATINVFGIAASGDYRGFCQQVASESGGSYFDVP